MISAFIVNSDGIDDFMIGNVYSTGNIFLNYGTSDDFPSFLDFGSLFSSSIRVGLYGESGFGYACTSFRW
jgi:hypothetical protein